MNVFVCWSGALSKTIAEAVETLLQEAFPEDLLCAVRSQQIEKGVLWANELRRLLEEANAGIVCLTPENLASPWLTDCPCVEIPCARKSASMRV